MPDYPCCEHCDDDWDYALKEFIPCGQAHPAPCGICQEGDGDE